MSQDRGRRDDVQVGVVLPCEGGRRRVLDRRARSDGIGSVLIEPPKRANDRGGHITRERDPFEGPADLRAERADRLTVVWTQVRQPIDPLPDGGRVRHDPPEGLRRHAEASRHANAFDPRELP